MLRPVTSIGLTVLCADRAIPPLVDEQAASKCSTELPPLLDAVNCTETDALPRVAVPIVGAVGTAAATNAFEAADAGLVPTAVRSVTTQVYVLPIDNAVTVIGPELAVADLLLPPFDDAHDAVKSRIGCPFDAPATNDTMAEASPRVAVPIVGASGRSPSTNGAEVVAGPVPIAFVAVTEHL